MTVAPTSGQVAGEPQQRGGWVVVAILALLLGGLAIALLAHFNAFGGSSGPARNGSGTPASQVRDVAPFSSIELAGANTVVIRVGEKQSVVVMADENLLDRVTTEVQSGNLVIANTPGNITTKSPMSVEVTLPALSALTLSGSGTISVNGLQTESLEVALPGSGTITGSGTATRLDVMVSGSGTVQFTQVVADEAQVVLRGSGSIFVTASRSLNASLSGTGTIHYSGNPQHVTTSVTGTGSISRSQ
jgi:hypothetical protein